MRDPVSKKNMVDSARRTSTCREAGRKGGGRRGGEEKGKTKKGEKEERGRDVRVWGGATCLAARQTGRQRRGLWEDARRWLETSGEGMLPFYSPLGCRMAGVLCAGGKMNERGGTWLGLYGDSNVHLG